MHCKWLYKTEGGFPHLAREEEYGEVILGSFMAPREADIGVSSGCPSPNLGKECLALEALLLHESSFPVFFAKPIFNLKITAICIFPLKTCARTSPPGKDREHRLHCKLQFCLKAA